MTRDQLLTKWAVRRDELARLGAQVDGRRVCEEIIQDLRSLADERIVNLTQASALTGYSREHLGRLVRRGEIPNVGRRNAPRVRVTDLPRKVGHLPGSKPKLQIGKSSKRRIVRSIVNSEGVSR